jgi:hypothetical protein
MASLKELIQATNCRTGKPHGTTRHGAYWLAHEPILLQQGGGDGLGQNAPSTRSELLLRYYRDGNVQASIFWEATHQNGAHGGAARQYSNADYLLECDTVEEVIVALKRNQLEIEVWDVACYSDRCESKVTDALVKLGMPLAAPSPDEA